MSYSSGGHVGEGDGTKGGDFYQHVVVRWETESRGRELSPCAHLQGQKGEVALKKRVKNAEKK